LIDYAAAVAFLDARIGLGIKPGLDRMRGLLQVMADPHLAIPMIHVAGTNGKTSTTRYIASILANHGLTPGAFTSPHLETVEQRYAVGADHLTPREFAALVAEVAPIVELFERRSGSGVTYFEVTAAMAFSLFAGYPASVGVIEVGLGGRLDATNVVEPDVAVITTIGRDHMGFLGDEVGLIAQEKAAIIKEGCIAVSGDLAGAAEEAVATRADEVGAQRFRMGTDFSLAATVPAVGGSVVDIDGVYANYQEIPVRAHGLHQAVNFAVAVAAAEAFVGRGLDELAVAEAGAIATPGRMEVIATAPLLMLDGAHNAQAAAALAAALEGEFPDTKWSLVFGAMGDKEVDSMLASLAPRLESVFAVAADSPRAIAPDQLVEAARKQGLAAFAFSSVPAGLRAAVEDAGVNGAVLVAGSIYVAGEARRAWLAPPAAGGRPSAPEH
jgi:dihydrofolate synthase/folylpolyglutamate synthase